MIPFRLRESTDSLAGSLLVERFRSMGLAYSSCDLMHAKMALVFDAFIDGDRLQQRIEIKIRKRYRIRIPIYTAGD